MTTKPDSGGEGMQESANSEHSNSQPNQKGSSGESQYVTVDQFQTTLNQSLEQFRRSLQSDKDKGIKRVEGEVGELRTLLERYAQDGKSVSDVVRDLDEQEEREARKATLEFAKMLREGKFPTGSQGSEQQKGVNVSEVMADLELDETDTRVQAFRAKQFSSTEEAYREGARLRKQMATRQPSDADSPSPETKRQSLPKDEQERLRQDYETRSKNVYGTALVRMKAEYRAKGLQV